MRHAVAAAIVVVGAGASAGGDVGAGGRGGVLLVVGHAFYFSAFPCIYAAASPCPPPPCGWVMVPPPCGCGAVVWGSA